MSTENGIVLAIISAVISMACLVGYLEAGHKNMLDECVSQGGVYLRADYQCFKAELIILEGK